MDIEKYLTAFEVYRNTVFGIKKAVRRMNAGKTDNGLPVGEMMDFVDYEELEREYEKKRRILSHATKRLQKAISKIRDERLSNYLVCKYLCGMTNERIAEDFNYCSRQVYRISALAKKELKRLLPRELPTVGRGERNKRYTFSERKAKKSYRKFGPKARRRGKKL